MLNKKTVVPSLLLLLTACIWGFAFVAQVEGGKAMGSLTFGGLRFAIGTVSLLPVLLIFERKRGPKHETRDTLRYGAAAGAVLFAASALQQWGVDMTRSAGKAAFITGLYTVLVPLFCVFLGKKVTIFTALGAVAAFAGLYFLSAPEGLGHITLGDVSLIACAACWALHILVIDAFAGRVRPIRFSVVQFAVCALLSLAAMFMFEQPHIAQLRAGLSPLLYGGLLSVGVAYTLQIVAQPHVEPARSAIIFSLEALFAAIGGFLLLQERLGWKGYLGGALMFLGIILSQIKRKSKRKQ